MRDLFLFIVSVLSATSAHHEVHFVPAHVLCPNVTGDKDILLPSPTDCAVYYKCENGMAIPQSCPDGLEWCKILSECTLPMLANCTITHTVVTYSPEELATYNPNITTTESPTTSPEDICPFDGAKLPNPINCSLFYICENGEAVSQSCPTGQKYSCWDQMCEADENAECINSGNQEGHNCTKENEKLPRLDNCTNYYKCVNGLVAIESCDDGLYYSPWKGTCTKSDTDCKKYLEETATSTVSSTESSTQQTTTSTSYEDSFCPFDGAKLPNPLNCSLYYICKNNEAVSQSCPTGQKYSCWDQMCESDENAECINSGNQEGHDCTKENEKLPRLDNCTSYYKCVNGSVVVESCDDGLYFNPWEGTCTNNDSNCEKYLGETAATTVSSTESSSQQTTTSTSYEDSFCPFDGAKLPNPLNCSLYYICKNNEAVSQSCPTGQKYSCWDQMCESDENAECINSANQEGHNCTKENEKLPRLDNCTSYYKCVNGSIVVESCDDGLYFNPWEGTCANNDSNCEKYLGGTATTTVSSTETSTASTTNKNSSNTPSILCPKDGILYPSFRKDCQGYMECIDGQPVAKKCDPPTYNYNCETKKCENITHCCAPGATTPSATSSPSNPTDTTVSTETLGTETSSNPSSESTTSTGTGSPSTDGPSNPTNPTISTESPGTETSPNQPNESTIPTSTGSDSTDGPSNPTNPTISTESLGTETSLNPSSESTTATDTGSDSTDGPSNPTNPTISTESPGTETSPNQPNESTTPTGTESSSTGSPSNPTNPTISTESPVTETSPNQPNESTTPTGTESSSTSSPSNPTNPTISTESPGTETSPNQPNESTTPTGTESSSTGSPSNPTNPTEPTVSPAANTTGPTDSGTINPMCSRDGLMYPSYTGDCHGYMICIKGKLVSKKCDPPTYNYNCETKKCEDITHCCATPSPTTPIPETTTAITSPSLNSDICPEDGAKLPNPVNCTSFYICQNNNPISQECPEGEEYSCWDQECKLPKDATCIKEGSQQGHTCTKEGEQNANLDDCSSYYKCTSGKIEIIKCASGTFYNKWFKNCVNYSLSWCQTYPTIPPTSTIEPPPSTIGPNATNDICPIEGATLPNVLDCNSYYYCINGEPKLHYCPSNQVYSCWDQTCLPETEGHCIILGNSPGDNCSIDGLQSPNIHDCKSYYECRNNSLIAITCPEDTMYNSWFKKCVKDKYAHCQTISTLPPTGPTSTSTTESTVSPAPNVCPQDGAQLPNPTDCSAYYICQNGKPVPHKCPKGQEYSCWDQKCEIPSSNSTCIKDGHQEGHSCSIIGEMMPNIANCSSFYICINGKVELHVCAGGAIYSGWFKMCLDVSIFGHLALEFCKVLPTLPPITLPTLPPATIPPSTTSDVCPVDHALLPNPLDCSTYYECINNTPLLQKCPIGMEYSCWDQKCENGSNAACRVTVGEPGKRCSKDGVKVSDAEDCSKYYLCESGKIVARNCLPGLQFNDRYQKCLLPQYAHCKPIDITVTPTTGPSKTSTVTPSPVNDVCPNEGALLPNPLNCSTYYKCVNSTPVLQLCAAGLEYSCWDSECMAPADAKCIALGITEGQKCTNNGEKLPNPDNCQTYYECVNGHVTLKKCFLNWYYNKWFHACLPFENLAHCHKNDKPPKTTTTKPKPTTTIPPLGPNDICPEDGALLPNPTDCSGYYKCINNKPVPQKCPSGQEYSCWDQMCEPASNAQCIAVGSQRGQSCNREGVTLQNIESCSSYFVCHNGIVEQNYCFIGFEYNKWYGKCTLALFSHCKTSPLITKPPTKTTTEIASTVTYPPSKVCTKDGVKVPNPNDCHTYFVCENKRPVLHTCPKNQNYDCWDQQCNPAILSRCINTPKAYKGEPCFKEGETVPDIKNCKKYYVCEDGKIVDRKCPFLEQYSVWNQKCMLIGVGKCANDKWLGII